MMTYCLVWKKTTDNFNARMKKTKIGRMMLLTQRDVCGNAKSRFISKNDQKAERLLRSLGIRTPLSKLLLLNLLF